MSSYSFHYSPVTLPEIPVMSLRYLVHRTCPLKKKRWHMGMQAKQAGDALRLDANRGRHWSMKSRPAFKTSEPSCSLVVRVAYFREQRALGAPKYWKFLLFCRQSFTLSLPITFLFLPLFAVSSSLEPPLLVPPQSNKSLHRLYTRLYIFI